MKDFLHILGMMDELGLEDIDMDESELTSHIASLGHSPERNNVPASARVSRSSRLNVCSYKIFIISCCSLNLDNACTAILLMTFLTSRLS